MEMDAVLTSFAGLCDSPAAWAILAGVGLHATLSVVWFLHCPILRGVPIERAEADRMRVNAPSVHSPRFLVTMLTGIALAIGGLYALRGPDAGPLAVGAIMVGVYMLLSEPARHLVEENALRVSASRLDGPEAYAFAHDRLRAAHIERIATEFGMFSLLAIFIVVM